MSQRQPGTGRWLLESPEFREWVDGDTHTLLCHRIPGAGKTMMTTTVVDYLWASQSMDSATGIAYIYLNYRRSEEQTVELLLGNVLKQLAFCRGSVWESLQRLYEKSRSQMRSSPEELSDAAQSILQQNSRTFVIIDALDECQSHIYKLLQRMFCSPGYFIIKAKDLLHDSPDSRDHLAFRKSAAFQNRDSCV